MSATSDPVDDGLPSERTDLAWNRSGLAVVACVAVLVRRIWPLHGADQVVALVAISAGAFMWAAALSVGRAVRAAHDDRRALSRRRAMVMTTGTLLLAIAAFVLALLSPA